MLEIVIAGGCLIILLFLALGIYFSTKPPEKVENQAQPAERPRGPQHVINRRARMRQNVAGNRQQIALDDAEEAEEDPEEPEFSAPDGQKLGAKKKAKLEAKAAKKTAREAEEILRKKKKESEALAEEERKKAVEQETLEEKLRLEAEKKEIEERERKEYEEYLKMKAAFSVEGEGFDEEGDSGTERNLIHEFIEYIKKNKVVVIEDLASHFKLKTQAAIDRITKFQADGLLTGVVDDRGKFIYISQNELENVAKFIKQRGRVSIADLVESSNQLINLTPAATT